MQRAGWEYLLRDVGPVRERVLKQLDAGESIRLARASKGLYHKHVAEEGRPTRLKLVHGTEQALRNLITPQLIQWAGMPLHPRAGITLTRTGSVETVRWAHRQGQEFDRKAMSMAILEGSLDVVSYLIETAGVVPDEESFAHAASSGSEELLRYLHGVECPRDERAVFRAAAKGNFELVSLLLAELECRSDGWTREVAEQRCQSTVLRLLNQSDGY